MHASLAFFVPTTMPGDFRFFVCFFLRKVRHTKKEKKKIKVKRIYNKITRSCFLELTPWGQFVSSRARQASLIFHMQFLWGKKN